MSLVCDRLAVARGPRVVLRGLSLTVSPGDFLVVAGPNGAGKTSLLRVLSGELAPAAGAVRWDLRPVRSIPRTELARRRAFLSQQMECRLPFTVEEIIQLGAEAAGRRGLDARAAVAVAMGKAGVDELAGRVISELSGGEQQRVHWARMLAQIGPDPSGRILFLDEPVSSLDLEHQHNLLHTARRLSEAGAMVIAVLHDLNLAATYAARILLLHNGRAVVEGSPATVLTAQRLEDVFRVRARILDSPGQRLLVVVEAPGGDPAPSAGMP